MPCSTDSLRHSWVNKWAPNPGYNHFSSPGLARLHFFILQKLGSPPANIYTKTCVLSRPETCGIDDAVNWQLIGTGQKQNRFYPAAAIYRIASINSNSFFLSFYERISFKGDMSYTDIPQISFNSWYFQQMSDFRIGWLTWHVSRTLASEAASLHCSEKHMRNVVFLGSACSIRYCTYAR